MGTIFFIIIVVVVLGAIKEPSPKDSASGELTEARRRQLRRAARRARQRNSGGLPWFGNGKRNRRTSPKYYWDD